MASNEYHFVTRWHQAAPPEIIFEILEDGPGLARWWPSVYLDVSVQRDGPDPAAVSSVSLYTKGWLPYTLRWRFRVTDRQPPTRLSIEADGDFVGRGVWTLTQTPTGTDVEYDWRISAEKPLLRSLSFLLKPLFAANHRWAMQQGDESLRLELARRAATTDEERERIPAPPGPTPGTTLRWLGWLILRK